jgi:hypothetical protein
MAIGTAIAAVAGGALGLFGASKSASAAKNAASAQERSAREATALQREMFNTTRSDMMPWLDAGKTALGKMMSELGINEGGGGFATSPGYEFRVQQGEKGVLNSLSSMGMKNSGKALKSLETFRQGIASDEYNNWLNRVAGIAGAGQSQSTSLGGMGQNAANAMGQNMQSAGAARASGYVGASNAWSQGIGQVGNALGQLSQTSGYRPQNYFPPAPPQNYFPPAPAGGGGFSGVGGLY